MSIKLMTAAWSVSVPHADKLVLLALADNANDEGLCFPSISTLAEKCGIEERSIFRALARLEEGGHLTRNQRAGRSTVYRVHPCPKVTPDGKSPLTQGQVTPDRESPPPLTVRQGTPDLRSPITITESSVEPSRNHSEGRERFAELVAEYPKFAGRQSVWLLAERICCQLVEGGESWAALIEAARRYRVYCDAVGRTGTNFVTGPHKHFGGTDWREEWQPPPEKAQRQQDGNVSAVQEWLSAGQ